MRNRFRSFCRRHVTALAWLAALAWAGGLVLLALAIVARGMF